MATRTHKAKYEAQDDSLGRTRSVCHAKHATEIYYKFEDERLSPRPSPRPPSLQPPLPLPL